jgi:hypothetical protein
MNIDPLNDSVYGIPEENLEHVLYGYDFKDLFKEAFENMDFRKSQLIRFKDEMKDCFDKKTRIYWITVDLLYKFMEKVPEEYISFSLAIAAAEGLIDMVWEDNEFKFIINDKGKEYVESKFDSWNVPSPFEDESD